MGTPGSIYDGVRGGGQGLGYYEPDSSDGADGDGYSPRREENAAETGRDVTVRDFPGLFERANEPFRSIGLDMPWYSAFGNHDALVQGNGPDAYFGPLGAGGETSNPGYQTVATGCLKPSNLPAAFADNPEGFLALLASDPEAAAAAAAPNVVPPDAASLPRRQGRAIRRRRASAVYERRLDPAALPDRGHSRRPRLRRPPARGRSSTTTATTRSSHGPGCASLSSTRSPTSARRWSAPRVRSTTLSSTGCGARSSLLRRPGRTCWSSLITPCARFVSTSTDPSEQPLHFGQRFDRRGGQPQNPSGGQTLEELFCEHPNVIAHIAGHEHENYVERHRCAADTPSTPGAGEFWHVVTAAHIDWPQQSRMIELIDNGDGTISLALTILDHDGPANPGGPQPPRSGQGQAAAGVLRLAAIGREIAYNDYQSSRGARGATGDRNVLIVIDRPPPGS